MLWLLSGSWLRVAVSAVVVVAEPAGLERGEVVTKKQADDQCGEAVGVWQ
jgi:hypothetical protein